MASIKSIHILLNDAAELLDCAASEIRDVPLDPAKENIQLIGEALANILQIKQRLYKQAPNLRPRAEVSELTPDPEISEEERTVINALSEKELEKIDIVILSHARGSWQKVALVVGKTMIDLENRPDGLSDLFYAERVKKLIEGEKLDARGNLNYMRFSEVRLPPKGREIT